MAGVGRDYGLEPKDEDELLRRLWAEPTRSERRREWLEDASCRGEGPAAYYGEALEPERAARCCGCPVRVDCLVVAMRPPVEVYGWWGGLTYVERRSLRRRLDKRRRAMANGMLTELLRTG